jgi:hypothetical protein
MKLSEEHVFPATIGGAFIITTVCGTCNEKLGKTIDLPFSRHEMVAWYRNILQIKRIGATGSRSIPNPVKGSHTNKDGYEYYVNFKDGIAKANIIRKPTPPVESSSEYVGCKIREHLEKMIKMYNQVKESNLLNNCNEYLFNLID